MLNSEAIPTVLKNYRGSVAEPTKKDVLCGKDTTLSRHPGNQIFREKIQAELPHYLKARSKQDKMKITKSIVQFVTVKQGARFLKLKGNGSWVEIDSQACRDKVSHALRFAAKQQKKIAIGEQSDESSSQGSMDDTSSSCSTVPLPPPPMPGRQEMERDTTNVEELFKVFEHPLAADPLAEAMGTARRASRRDSSRLLLSFLSTIDFGDDQVEQAFTGPSFSFDEQERHILAAMGGNQYEEVTQWATC
jgi:hypothetical protein